MMDKNKFIQLITKELSGSISTAERRTLKDEIARSNDSKQTFKYLSHRWELSGKLKPKMEVNIEWHQVLSKINSPNQSTTRDKLVKMRSWYYAAAGLVLLLTSLFLLRYYQTPTPILHVALNAPITVTLPDSSVVSLNKGATIQYAEDYNKDKRAINLTGEAFFEVSRNKEKPFIVTLGQTEVEVLGTSFNISSNEKITEVVVVTGTVSFSTRNKNSSSQILTAGLKGVFDKSTQQLSKVRNEDPNFMSWQNKKLNFKSANLTEVISALKTYFDIQMVVKEPGLNSCQFTMEFDDPTLEEVMDILSISADIEYEIVNQIYYLSGPGCN